jgi:hypothetical protein
MSISNVNNRIIIKLLGSEQNKINFKKNMYKIEDLQKEFNFQNLKEIIKKEFENNKNTHKLSKSQEDKGNITKLKNGINNKLYLKNENEIENDKKDKSLEEIKKLNNNDGKEFNDKGKTIFENLKNNYDVISFNSSKLKNDDIKEKGKRNILNYDIKQINSNEKNNNVKDIKTLNKKIENNNLSQSLFLKGEIKKISNSISKNTKENQIRLKYYNSYKKESSNKKNKNQKTYLKKLSFTTNYRNGYKKFTSFSSSFIPNNNNEYFDSLLNDKNYLYLNKEKMNKNLQNKKNSINDNNTKILIKNNSISDINKCHLLQKMKSFIYNNNLYIYGKDYFNKYSLKK